VTTPSTPNPVSATAYWTLASRAEDATRERPIADDRFAHRFMSEDARAVAKRLASLKKPYSSFPVRHRIIDDLLAAELSADPNLRVVLIGSGFDSRPFRLQGGRWVEIDEPDLLAYKESRLPAAESPQELERVPIRFGEESLESVLAAYASPDRVAVVLEGVLGYLSDDERRRLLSTLTRVFPNHVVFCDLVTRTFLRRHARNVVKLLRELGAEFSASNDTPDALFHELGYETREQISVVLRGAALGAPGAPPRWVVRRLRSLRNGYCVWAFEHAGTG
jgi:methyltransferase (TIGR00027 family)